MSNQQQQQQQQQQQLQTRKKGGFITLPFIIANEAFEKVSSYGLLPNMILYLMQDYGMDLAKGAHVLFIWSAATNFTPLVGAFIADSYLGRFLSIGLGSISSLLGMILLWLTAMIPQLKPPTCHTMITTPCNSASPFQLAFLFSSFALMSVGAGGVRPCSLAFGADQLDKHQGSTNNRVLESYFGWYYASAAVSVLIAFTGIVYIQDQLGWKIGFGVPALLMFLSASLFFMASSLYVKNHASTNLLVNFVQVIVASYKKRKLPFPTLSPGDECYHHGNGPEFLVPTDKLRFLNKACIIRSHEEEMRSDGSVVNPWRTCTVEQVEQLKTLFRILPIWSTGIMMSVNTSQGSFQLLQANSMDRHLTRSFQIPAGSYAMFLIISLASWIVLYDRIILPLASKLYGKPVHIGVKLRMGIGLFLTSLAMVVSATVEHVRRCKAAETLHLLKSSTGVVTMSAMWLIPQYVIQGLAEAFNAIGQTEFYYSEFPKSMSSIAAALFGLGMAVASLLASAILSVVDGITSRNGHTSWVSSDINAGRFDWYYWVLATLSFINVMYFIICSLAYGPCSGDIMKIKDQKIEEELSMLGSIQVHEHKEDLPVSQASSC